MLAQEEVMLVQGRRCKVRSKENGPILNLRHYAYLLHFLEDSGSGVSVDQFAWCKTD